MEDKKYFISLLKDPMLLKRLVLDGLDEVIVGEEIARKTIFICSMGSLVINSNKTSFNLLVNSESGAGKDHLVNNVLKVLPKDHVLKRTRISPTVLNYWHNSRKEPNWTWDGKVLYLEDCSNDIFNSEVFKVFTSGSNYATIVKDQKTVDLYVRGKPVVIVTSASADPNPEMIRRFIVIGLDESKKQTKEVMDKWVDHAKRGFIPKIENDYKNALVNLQPRKVKIPWAKNISKNFNEENISIIMRTNMGRFIDFIKASAVLHQFARKKDSEDYILADKQDYEYAREIVLETSSNNKMIPLTKIQTEILEIMKQLGKQIKGEGNQEYEVGWSATELSNKIIIVSKRRLWTNLKKLVKIGFLQQETIKDEYSKRPYTVFNYKKQPKLKILNWEEINK